MSEALRQRFRQRVILADGAMGSELVARMGATANIDLAPIENPEAVLEAHLAYVEAGAEILETATFHASRPRLEHYGAGDEVSRLNAAAVKLAREAREIAGADCLVAGAIGPLAGTIDIDDAKGLSRIIAAHAEQAEALAGRGADLLFLETFFRIDELELAARAIKAVTDLPLIGLLSLPIDKALEAAALEPSQLRRLESLGFFALGLNCAPGPQAILEALNGIDLDESVELACLPNSGQPIRRDGRVVIPPSTPTYFGRVTRAAAELGATLVGGCCGSGPDHIRVARRELGDMAPRTRRRVQVALPARVVNQLSAEPRSAFASRLAEGKFTTIVQLDPPKGTKINRLITAAEKLADQPSVTAVDVNSNPLARVRMDSLWLSAEIQRTAGLETIPHVTPRDASLMGLQSQLLGAWHAGIRNLLAITGDPSQLGDYPGVHDVYHVDIFELVRAIRRMADGFDCAGNRIGSPPDFFVGVAVNPTADDLDHEIERFKRKVDAGAQFAMTQVFFDWAPYERMLEKLGGTSPIPILAAVWPLTSLRLAERLHHEVPGIEVPLALREELDEAGPAAAEVGREKAVEMLRAAPNYAAGAYLIAPFKRPQDVLALVKAADLEP